MWYFSTIHQCTCKLIEEQSLWGQHICLVWLPEQETVVRVLRSSLRPVEESQQPQKSADQIAYIAAAAKVAQVLETTINPKERHVLLSLMASKVIPLPHQILTLSRAISADRVRYLLADEVGLGKTIEAGLIMKELKLRGRVRKTLIVVPRGLITQWVSEMQMHFNEQFLIVQSETIATWQRLFAGSLSEESIWSKLDQVIVSLDSVKPVDRRVGWSEERLTEYNRTHFERLITAEWDLIIVDEAHRLSGSTDQVARYKLGRALSEAAPYVLFLSATPHQGKSDGFYRLMNLLDEKAFPDIESVNRDRVAPYVLRTEKRKAIDENGHPLFKTRTTQLIPVRWEERHSCQRNLYEMVTDYVREGYNQSIQENKRYIGFLMVLMQRLVVSSTRAIRTALEGRIGTLRQREQERDFSADVPEDVYDMDGQEVLECMESQLQALRTERGQVEKILEVARDCERMAADTKAETLLEWIYRLQSDEKDYELKVLLFTEFVATQEMLREFLKLRGFSVATLNGRMSMEQRSAAQETFRDSARILISTDAGGEGLNLQFCHVVVNYDIPWNPMRLEQRIGRVDRIGQKHSVIALNFLLEESVEYRVREVLQEKLSIISKELGIDRADDIIDSAESGKLFEEIFTTAILNPSEMETTVDHTLKVLQEEMLRLKASRALYGESIELDTELAQSMQTHPLPHWLKQMTESYIRLHSASAEVKKDTWDLTRLTLEEPRIRNLASHLPVFSVGRAIPQVEIEGLPSVVSGYWGLIEIRLQAGISQAQQTLQIPMTRTGFFCLFINEQGKVFLPTAQRIWDILSTSTPEVKESIDIIQSEKIFLSFMETVQQTGEGVFCDLLQRHRDSLAQEEERGKISFESRRKAIQRIGLPEVKHYRLTRCDQEETEWKMQLKSASEVIPEIRPLLIVAICPKGKC